MMNLAKRRAIVTGLCWLSYLVMYLLRSNLSVALPYIEGALSINKSAQGLLGSAFLWVYGAGQLVNGNLGDRHSAKLFIGIGVLACALCNLGFGFSTSYAPMLIFWAVNGWFASMLWGPIAKTVSLWHAPEKRGGVVVAVSTSMTVGALCSLILSGAMAEKDWRMIFFAPAVIGLIYVALHMSLFRDAPAPERRGAEPAASGRVSIVRLFRRTRLSYVVAACLSQGIVKDGISLWSAVFFVETYNLDIRSAVLTLVLIPVCNFLGVLCAGWLYRKFPSRLERLTACVFGVGVALIALLLLYGRQNLIAAMILLALSSAAMYGANTLLLGIFPMAYDYCGRVSAVAGFLDFCAYLAAGCTALLSGFMIDKVGWEGVMVLWLVVAALGVAALTAAERSRLTYHLDLTEEA